MADDAESSAFLVWCAECGVQLSSVAVEWRAGKGKCLASTRRCAAGECLAVVPAVAIIAEGRQSDYKVSHWTVGIVHRLLEEDALGRESRYAPFVGQLFSGSEPPEREAWASLPGSIGRRARGEAELHERILGELCEALPCCSRRRAAQALHAVGSRTLYSQAAGVRALVPVFDCMNHDAKPNAVWSMGEDRTVLITATRTIAALEEITICYDSIPNSSLLFTYGFVLGGAEGPHRAVDLLVAMPPGSALDAAEGAAADGATVVSSEIRVLADGSVARRAAVVPLLAVARNRVGYAAADALLAVALRHAACAEKEEWLLVEAGGDARVTTLRACCLEELTCFVERLGAWQDSGGGVPLMAALGRTPSPELATTSSASGDRRSGSASILCGE